MHVELWFSPANTTNEPDYVRINVVKGHFHEISEKHAAQGFIQCRHDHAFIRYMSDYNMARLTRAAEHNPNASDIYAEMVESTLHNTLVLIGGDYRYLGFAHVGLSYYSGPGHCQQAVDAAKKLNPRLTGLEEGEHLHSENGRPVNDLDEIARALEAMGNKVCDATLLPPSLCKHHL